MKSILITGSTRGIGLEITKKLWLEDNDISNFILLNRDCVLSEHIAHELEVENPYNKKVTFYIADLSDAETVVIAVEKIINKHEKVDILINCAGFTDPQPIQQVSSRNLYSTFQVNFFSPFIIIRNLLRAGNSFTHIVNIASTAGITGRSGWTAYSASKAAIINFSDALREELDIFSTRVICLSPGRCATDLRKILAPDEDPNSIMQPDSMADIVSIMLGKNGRFIDTNNIVVRQ